MGSPVHLLGQIAAIVAAGIHVMFFCFESLLFSRPAIYRRFLISSQQEAGIIRPWAFNQGFYNLFLAAGAFAGVVIANVGSESVGRALIAFACGCMALAGAVLVASDRRMARPALIQLVPPLTAVIATLV